MQTKHKLRYILVEDSISDTRLFQIVWKEVSQGEELITFTNATDSLNYFDELKEPTSNHIIVLDLNLPGMSGLDCLALLRQKEVTRHSPIILFSTSASEQDVSKAYLNLATSYVQKPSDLKSLKIFVSSLLTYWSYVIPPRPNKINCEAIIK